ncbi:MAG: DUF2214 domain-containing protein [Pseudohongiella sp.]|nr:DUF2214 domain-containing protein [Pseudohongiella sp.]
MPELAEFLSQSLGQIAQWPLALFLRQSAWAYPLVNSLHILSIGLIVGAITTLDLRLLGVFREIPLAMLARPLVRVAQTGVVLTLLSGVLLFSVQPANYLSNSAFQIKLVLMSLAILNALIVHRLPQWQGALDNDRIHPVLVTGALLSLLLWILTILAGRWIAFV